MKTQLIRFAAGSVIFALFSNGMCSSSDPNPATPLQAATACQLRSAASSDGTTETYVLDSQNRLASLTISSGSGQTVFSLVYGKTDGRLSLIDGSRAGKQLSITSLSRTAEQLTQVENTVYAVDAYSNPYGGYVSLKNLINTANVVWQGDRLAKVNTKASAQGQPKLGDGSTTYDYDATGNVSKLSGFNNSDFGGLVETGLTFYITYEYEDKILQPKQQTGVPVQFDFLDDGQIGVQPVSPKAVKKASTYLVNKGQAELAATTTYTNTANSQGYLVKSVGKTTYSTTPGDTETIMYVYGNCQ